MSPGILPAVSVMSGFPRVSGDEPVLSWAAGEIG